MIIQKQHADYFRKKLLRSQLLRQALPGTAYVPFIGDGDLAVDLYGGREIHGADLDHFRVDKARARLPHAIVRVADCNSFPFSDLHAIYAVADFDAFSNPYLAFVDWWRNSEKTDIVVIFLTDGLREAIKRSKKSMDLPNGTVSANNMWRRDYNFWFTLHVKPFIQKTIAPWKVGTFRHYLRKNMLYCGCVLHVR